MPTTPAGVAAVKAEEKKKKRRAVIDGELIYTSVSQIQKALPSAGGCFSKWYFRYVLGLPDDPPGKGQIRGTQGHGRIEQYLLKGIDALDRLERNGLKHMPAPNVTPDGIRHPVPVLVEEHFGPMHLDDEEKPSARAPLAVLDAQGVPVVGYIDLVDPRELATGGPLWIKDWKFKKSISDYGVKRHQLTDPRHESGIQMIGYAEWARRAAAAGAFDAYGRPQLVQLAHVTFQTAGMREVVQTDLEKPIQLDSAKSLWETVTQSAIPGMRSAARAKSHTEVPKNEKVCQKYRKACPYIGTCLDRMARIRQGFAARAPEKKPVEPLHTEEMLMGMMTQMTGGKSLAAPAAPAAPAPAVAPAAAAAAAVVTAKPIQPESHLLTAGKALPNTDYQVNGASHRFLSIMKMGEASYASFTPTAGGAPVLVPIDTPISALGPPVVLPPDAPKSSPALAAEQPAVLEGIEAGKCTLGEKYDVNGAIGEFTGTSRDVAFFQTTAGGVKLALTDRVKHLKGEGIAPAGAVVPKGEPTASGPAVALAPPAEPEKKKRRKLLDVEVTPPAAAAPAPAATTAPVPTPVTEPAKQGIDGTPYGSMEGVHLYFGCAPIGVVTKHLGPYVDGLEAELKKQGQLNVSDVRIASDNVFGFNKWKGFLAEFARERPPPPGHYVITSHADERVSLVAETLAQRALPGLAVMRGGG